MFDKVPFLGPQFQVLNLVGASIFVKVHLHPRGSRPAPITGVALQIHRSSQRNGLPVGKLYPPQVLHRTVPNTQSLSPDPKIGYGSLAPAKTLISNSFYRGIFTHAETIIAQNPTHIPTLIVAKAFNDSRCHGYSRNTKIK